MVHVSLPLGMSCANGIIIIANTNNLVYNTVTGTFTRDNTGMTTLSLGRTTIGTLTSRIGTTNCVYRNCTTGILSPTVLRDIRRRILTSLNPYSVLIGNTNNGGPHTAASGRCRRRTGRNNGSFFSLRTSNISFIFHLGFRNALLPARIFTGSVIRGGTNYVLGVSSVGTCVPLAGVPTCSNTGTTVSGFAR